MSGPLTGVRVIELAGIGPGPFAGALLSDMGAEVVRVERTDAVARGSGNTDKVNGRGRRSIGVDLKHPRGVECVLRLVEHADALTEGFRPGVAERLGLGPDVCLARNPRLVYGRMTGWGQEGPLAKVAGHDINYIALAGALAHFGRVGQKPTPPINLIGDYGGGGMVLAFGVVCGILEARTSGQGQVVDAAMVDGATALMGAIWGVRAAGAWSDERGTNLLDTGAPFYEVYETSDGKYVSIGSIEPQFYAELIDRLGLAGEDLPAQMDRSGWPQMRERFTDVFPSKTRDEWCALLEGTDVCFAPVLTMGEAAEHPHIKARATVIEHDGIQQPAPAPRFSRTPGAVAGPAAFQGSTPRRCSPSGASPTPKSDELISEGAVSQAG